ncbi:lipopolysaccharide heptosyltransferase II [Petrachloros mirabilis]
MRNVSLKNIVVRGPNWLGDAVMCEPTLRELKTIAPDARISLLVKPAVAELFKGHPCIDRIIVYDDKGRHAGLAGKWKLAGELRQMRFDFALLFQNAFEAALITFGAGIPQRYGYATDGRSFLLSDPVALPDQAALVHQVEYYWNLLRPLGLTGDPPAPELFVTRDEERAMTDRLEQMGIHDNDLVIGINPGSTYGGAKRWLPERFAEVANRLVRTLSMSREQQISVIILGARGEEKLGAQIAGSLSVRSASLSGTTTIRELMAAVKRCALLITNDTGPMHLAAAFRVPLVAIFGPTDWRTTSPYRADHTIVRQPVDCAPCMLRECPIDHRCMTGVSADQVYEATLKLLDGQRARGEGREAGEGDPAHHASRITHHAALEGYTIFLDRDGTLNHDPGYLKSAAELRLLPGVAAALARLKSAGARLVVVTNQSGVGRGYFTLKDLEAIHARLQGLLEQEGAVLDAVYFCPHHPDNGCLCRKPKTGMVERAVSELQLDLQRSYMVGDHPFDVQLARNIGARAVLLRPEPSDGRVEEVSQDQSAAPDVIVKSISEAAEWILLDAAVSGTDGLRAARQDAVSGP